MSSTVSLSRTQAAALAERIRARRPAVRDAPVRLAFITNSTGTAPMGDVLRGGRSGQVALKLYLSVLWAAVGELDGEHSVAAAARGWAELLGLDEPATNGARRVQSAIKRLEQRHLLSSRGRPGLPRELVLRSDAGDNTPYFIPGKAKQLDHDTTPHRYVKVPARLWTEGWIAKLSGAAIASYLVLLTTQPFDRTDRIIFGTTDTTTTTALPETVRRAGLSQDTFRKGTRELQHHRLLRIIKRPASQTMHQIRFRNEYILEPVLHTTEFHVTIGTVPGNQNAPGWDRPAWAGQRCPDCGDDTMPDWNTHTCTLCGQPLHSQHPVRIIGADRLANVCTRVNTVPLATTHTDCLF